MASTRLRSIAFLKATLAVLLPFLVAACTGDAQTHAPAPTDPAADKPAIIAPNVTILDLATTEQATVEQDRLVFPIQGNDALVHRVPGDILRSAAYASKIFLRRITSVQSDATTITFSTTQATYADAIIQGHLQHGIDPMLTTRSLRPRDVGGALGNRLDALVQLGDKDCGGTSRVNRLECSLSGGGGLYLTGHNTVDFRPSLDVGLDFSNGALHEVHVAVGGTLTHSIDMRAQLSGTVQGKIQYVFWTGPFDVFWDFIGPFPIAVMTNVKGITGCEFNHSSGSPTISAGGSVTASLTEGVRWDGQWHPINRSSVSASLQGPTFSDVIDSEQLKCFVGGELEVLFEGAAGPTFELRGYVAPEVFVTANVAAGPQWDIKLGADGSVGGTADLLGQFDLGSFEFTLFDISHVLGTGSLLGGAGGSNSGGGTTSSPPRTCPSGDGLYCGSDGVNGEANTLYQCTGGALSIVKPCSGGCQTMPAGINDQCTPDGDAGAGNPPPLGSCPSGNGLYCGSDGVSGEANTLYQCTNGALTTVKPCPSGCQTMPAGINDQCLPDIDAGAGTPPPLASCPSGNGLYCGSDGVNGDPNTLYQCTNGTLSISKPCPNGCKTMPAGVNDACN